MATVVILKTPLYTKREDRIPSTVLYLPQTDHVQFIKLLQNGQPFVSVNVDSLRAIAVSNIISVHHDEKVEDEIFPELIDSNILFSVEMGDLPVDTSLEALNAKPAKVVPAEDPVLTKVEAARAAAKKK